MDRCGRILSEEQKERGERQSNIKKRNRVGRSRGEKTLAEDAPLKAGLSAQ